MAGMTENQQRKGRLAGGMTAIRLRGFKSLVDDYRLAIRPLTILAGANSSGKSSAIQPLLLLKQTLDVAYDPGPLLLNGPNVYFTSATQFLSRLPSRIESEHFEVGFSIGGDAFVSTFAKQAAGEMQLVQTRYQNQSEEITLLNEMTHERLISVLPKRFRGARTPASEGEGKEKWGVISSRSFLMAALYDSDKGKNSVLVGPVMPSDSWDTFLPSLRELIHLPGLRGNPQRTYRRTAVGPAFPGTFEPYVASIIHEWQNTGDERLKKLAHGLATLGLTNQIDVQRVNDVEFEIRVGQLPLSLTGEGQPMVNIADVGFGVSQVLPVLVALLTAIPGQMIILEQPELHLHPRAQAALATLLIDAAKRGVRVVAETHSSLLLTAIQTLVALGKIAPNEVMLHWFQRDEDGVTQIESCELDEAGAFGEWPEDFGQVLLEVEGNYIDAAQARLMGG